MSLPAVPISQVGPHAGPGGCRYAPGAPGRVVIEDPAFLFEAMGVATGVELPRLLAVREPLRAGLPGEPIDGMAPLAGLLPGFERGVAHG